MMRSTTNILIINLAISDLMFVIMCIPFTASDYILTNWWVAIEPWNCDHNFCQLYHVTANLHMMNLTSFKLFHIIIIITLIPMSTQKKCSCNHKVSLYSKFNIFISKNWYVKVFPFLMLPHVCFSLSLLNSQSVFI